MSGRTAGPNRCRPGQSLRRRKPTVRGGLASLEQTRPWKNRSRWGGRKFLERKRPALQRGLRHFLSPWALPVTRAERALSASRCALWEITNWPACRSRSRTGPAKSDHAMVPTPRARRTQPAAPKVREMSSGSALDTPDPRSAGTRSSGRRLSIGVFSPAEPTIGRTSPCPRAGAVASCRWHLRIDGSCAPSDRPSKGRKPERAGFSEWKARPLRAGGFGHPLGSNRAYFLRLVRARFISAPWSRFPPARASRDRRRGAEEERIFTAH